MRAIVFDKELRYRENHPTPKPEGDEAFIRVTCAGICNTDLEIIKGYMGFRGILGHEFAGVIEKCGDERFAGKRVVGEINMRVVKPGGTIVLKTTAARREQVYLNLLVINEITVVGSRCGPFEPAIRALETKAVDVRPLISGYSL